MYENRGESFKVLESIYDFKSKNELKTKLDRLEKQINEFNTNILFVHYGGHGANSSSDHSQRGSSYHVNSANLTG